MLKKDTLVKRIALVGDYLPRKCGIATFTHDVHHCLTGVGRGVDCKVIAVNDRDQGYDYPPEVHFEIAEKDIESYRRAADFLNFSNTEVVCLQHEFGIFGGPAGSHILAFLKHLRIPVVAHLHTVLEKPNADQARVMREMARLVARFIVMTERARDMLTRIYGIDPERIDVIPHGIPDMPFVDPAFYKDQFGVEGKNVLLTFGLLSPGKGIEYVIRALPKVVKEIPNLVYIVLGATHPHIVAQQGETYRLGLERLAADLGVDKHVAFYNRFVELSELTEFIGAADVYITPYLNPAQITSGTLSYAFGCGKAVVSTPYWHAEELLADGRGVLVPFRDSDAIARELIALFKDDVRRNAMRKQAYLMGREMTWSHISHQFMESFSRARAQHIAGEAARLSIPTVDTQPRRLPTPKFDHILTLSDSTGIFQHATYTLPNFAEGYCTDDNARALLLTVLLEQTGDLTPELKRAMHAYAAFLNHAFVPETGRFRNFMSFDRRWLEECGSQDSHGRTLWALGACAGRTNDASLGAWATQLFSRALPAVENTDAPRTWAFSLIGIHEYFRRFSGDRVANLMRRTLTERLIARYRKFASEDWPWFEDILAYANARLPHALILSGRWMNHPEALEIGLKSLRWLVGVQTAEEGHFRPIGSNGFYPRGGQRAKFDQQPIEAHATVSACIEAYGATGDEFWMREAHRAFDWFLGNNDLGISMYDPTTGGCSDGLHIDRINLNQGAESTLAFHLALQEIRLAEDQFESLENLPAGEPIDEAEPAATS
ncbi:MAG: glycosyltransferase [Verrucomicrobia bacterium]|nr:MAG: glycosyltransferase [Verrucomicrobiota bacterium]